MEGLVDRRRRREIQRRGENTCDHVNVSIVLWALETPPLSPMTSLGDWCGHWSTAWDQPLHGVHNHVLIVLT